MMWGSTSLMICRSRCWTRWTVSVLSPGYAHKANRSNSASLSIIQVLESNETMLQACLGPPLDPHGPRGNNIARVNEEEEELVMDCEWTSLGSISHLRPPLRPPRTSLRFFLFKLFYESIQCQQSKLSERIAVSTSPT
jgi:hypothetical protein